MAEVCCNGGVESRSETGEWAGSRSCRVWRDKAGI